MDFTVKSGQVEKLKTQCIVVGVYQNKKLTASGTRLDKASKNHLSNIIKRGDLDGSVGQSLFVYDIPGVSAERILLVNVGKPKELDEAGFARLSSTVAQTLHNSSVTEATCLLNEVDVKQQNLSWKLKQLVIAAGNTTYEFTECLSKKSPKAKPLKKYAFCFDNAKDVKLAKQVISHSQAITQGMRVTKDLGNMPPNICTPSYLANYAKQMAKTHAKVSAKILTEAEMKKLKMGSLLSVSKGSAQPPKLITLEYKGAARTKKPIVLVGKGVTFDTGGISLKPSTAMVGMKFDMCGAATVFGTIEAVARMGLPINVTGVVPAVENMPSDRASKPDDVVTSMSGQTIEISNTDAEGRLILCDALTYAGRYKPDVVIDIATLTGAMVMALGSQATGVFSNNDKLAGALINAGQQIYDRAWQMPIWSEYHELLKSSVADFNNIGGPAAGSITAACFLSKFTQDYTWAHLDIAGTASKMERGALATGRPVPMLCEYILSRCGK